MQTTISDTAALILEEINSNPTFKKLICLNTRQAAEALGLSSSSLEVYRRQGLGPEYIKINRGKKGRIMYPKVALAEWCCRTIKTM